MQEVGKDMNKKNKILIGTSIILVIFCIIGGRYIYNFKNNYSKNHPIIEYKDTSRLQYIAGPMLEKYLEQYKINTNNKANEKISYYTYKSSQLIAGDSGTFAISAIFDVKPYDKGDLSKLSKWGLIDNDGMIHCDWTLIISKLEGNKYKLLDVLQTSDVKKKLGISKKNSNIIEPVVTADKCKYKIEKDDVYITYDGGKNWDKIPKDIMPLEDKDKQDTKSDDLNKGSYYISEKKTAFIYGLGSLCISKDKGQAWKNVNLQSDIMGIRRQFIGFTDEGFGYAIIAGDRAMSFEMIDIYISKDGGNTWDYKGPLEEKGSSLATGISFSTSKIGFITTKINSIYMTTNGGESWNTIELPMPEELKGIYDDSVAPVFKGSHGEIYVGQGDDGDYGAGKSQVCRFISDDFGKSWKYDGEVIK